MILSSGEMSEYTWKELQGARMEGRGSPHPHRPRQAVPLMPSQVHPASHSFSAKGSKVKGLSDPLGQFGYRWFAQSSAGTQRARSVEHNSHASVSDHKPQESECGDTQEV